MALASTFAAFDASWLHGLTGLLVRPRRLQIGALCHRQGKSGPEILLVSTREKGRMILPKGWPEDGRAAFETALTEAYEEAGVLGRVDREPLGSFRSHKGLGNDLKIRTKVVVFKIEYESQLVDFPERGQRKLMWLPIQEAISLADEPTLRRFLKRHRATIA